MSALVAFLRARLEEDEDAARAASIVRETATGDTWRVERGRMGVDQITRDTRQPEVGTALVECAPHVARHDPARVLADVAAQRALIDAAARIGEVMDGEWGCGHTAADILAGARHRDGEDPEPLPLDCEGPKELARVLGPLAAVHAAHPDYRQEWTP